MGVNWGGAEIREGIGRSRGNGGNRQGTEGRKGIGEQQENRE
jgi:hypothetical protein